MANFIRRYFILSTAIANASYLPLYLWIFVKCVHDMFAYWFSVSPSNYILVFSMWCSQIVVIHGTVISSFPTFMPPFFSPAYFSFNKPAFCHFFHRFSYLLQAHLSSFIEVFIFNFMLHSSHFFKMFTATFWMTIADTFNVVLHVFLSILRLVFYMSENIICHWMIWVSMSLGELQRAGGVQLSQPPYELCHRSTVSCQQGTTHTICTMLLPLHPQAYPTLPPSLPAHSSEEVILFHQKMNSFFSKYVLCTPSVTIISKIS